MPRAKESAKTISSGSKKRKNLSKEAENSRVCDFLSLKKPSIKNEYEAWPQFSTPKTSNSADQKSKSSKHLANTDIDLLQILVSRGVDVGITEGISNLLSKSSLSAEKTGKRHAVPPKPDNSDLVNLKIFSEVKSCEVKIKFYRNKSEVSRSPNILNLRRWLNLSVANRQKWLAKEIFSGLPKEKREDHWLLKFWYLPESPILSFLKKFFTPKPTIIATPYLQEAQPKWTWENFYQQLKEQKAELALQKKTGLRISLFSYLRNAFFKLFSPNSSLAFAPIQVAEVEIEEISGQPAWWENQVVSWPTVKSYLNNIEVQPAYQWSRSLAVFACLAVLVVLPIGGFAYLQQVKANSGQVLGISTQATSELLGGVQAAQSFDLTGAANSFFAAEKSFSLAQEKLSEVTGYLGNIAKILPINNEMNDGQRILAAGQNLASAAQDLANCLVVAQGKKNTEGEILLTEKIKILSQHLQLAGSKINLVQKNLALVSDNSIPDDKLAQWQGAKAALPQVVSAINSTIKTLDFLADVLGDGRPMRWLVLLQNDNELRASGGFLGTYALLDIQDGKIKKLELPPQGSYALKGSLRYRMTPPEPLRLVNSVWNFWDANWWPDFSLSAKKVLWLYQKSGGPSVDLVMSINAGAIKDLLSIIGPLEVAEQQIDQNNFYLVVQSFVESQANIEGAKPKQIITDLAPATIKKILTADPQQFLKITAGLSQSILKKDIQFFSPLPDRQQKIKELGFDGGLKETKGDYLAVISTNIAGGKTDQYISQNIRHQAVINSDGSIEDTIIITRAHNGDSADQYCLKENISYLRIYVPLGSQFISASGFNPDFYNRLRPEDKTAENDPDLSLENKAEIDELSRTKIYSESGKTVFANWFNVPFGETRELIIKYRLPYKISSIGTADNWLNHLASWLWSEDSLANYSLYVQKQSGSQPGQFFSEVSYPQNFSPYWFYPEQISLAENKLTARAETKYDFAYGAVFIKK